MYIFSFFKRITRKSNIPVFIYLILNVVLISGFAWLFFNDPNTPFWQPLLVGLGLYAVSLMISLSPFGEWVVRLENGCRKIKRREQKEFLMPLFEEVYARAREKDPGLNKNIRLYICSDSSTNAFALGRKTICVTEGLLYQPEDQIKAVLGHEFGHISHKDTDLILLVCGGNMIVTAIFVTIRLFADILHIISIPMTLILDNDIGTVITQNILHFIGNGLLTAFMWVWTKIGTLLVMKSSRSNEYLADQFSFTLGYGDSLCAFLDSVEENAPKGVFAVLNKTHPASDDRIARLQQLGSEYRASYGKPKK